ncbi:hypothetical protein HanPI659440_Chr13g0499601 [Helianthus annuus]|nr:hypothetical protein HanPI659440_Chr13g0499601 [Helianthus annuus]
MCITPSNTLTTADIEGLLLKFVCKHHAATFTISTTSVLCSNISSLCLSTISNNVPCSQHSSNTESKYQLSSGRDLSKTFLPHNISKITTPKLYTSNFSVMIFVVRHSGAI